SSINDERNVINQSILRKAQELSITVEKSAVIDFTPADSERKRSSAQLNLNNKLWTISVGAPQVVEALCPDLEANIKQQFHHDVEQAAAAGFRTLAIAQVEGKSETKMQLL